MTGSLCFGQYGDHRKCRLDFMESDTDSGAVKISEARIHASAVQSLWNIN
jgi:hypothetical protein